MPGIRKNVIKCKSAIYILNTSSFLSRNSFSTISPPGFSSSNSRNFSWKPLLSLMIAALALRTILSVRVAKYLSEVVDLFAMAEVSKQCNLS